MSPSAGALHPDRRGQVALRGGDTAAARHAFERALADGPSGEALEGPAEALYLERQYPAAAAGYDLLRGPQGQMVYGDLEPRIELPAAAPIR